MTATAAEAPVCAREHNYTVEDAGSVLYCDTSPDGALAALAHADGEGSVVAEHESDVPDSNGPGAAYCPAESERIKAVAAAMGKPPRRPRELTPADVTARFPSFRSGRLENWAAKSRDGVWDYERMEDTGTLWDVTHRPSGLSAAYYGTLTAAREATANGSALACVERLLAHQRGEHEAGRDPACRGC